MLTYRRIDQEDKWPELIWAKEAEFPGWFKVASRVWTPDRESFNRFWNECDEVHGLFDGDELLACIYLEYIEGDPTALNIHLSVVSDIRFGRAADLIRFFKSLKNLKASEGVRHMEGWFLFRERRLKLLAEAAGFMPTGLVMKFGNYRGKTFEWHQVRG